MGAPYYICWVCGLPPWCLFSLNICVCHFMFTTIWIFFPVYHSLLLMIVELDNVLVCVLSSGYGCFLFLLGFAGGEPTWDLLCQTSLRAHTYGFLWIQMEKSCILSKRPQFFLIHTNCFLLSLRDIYLCQDTFPSLILRIPFLSSLSNVVPLAFSAM